MSLDPKKPMMFTISLFGINSLQSADPVFLLGLDIPERAFTGF